MAIRPTTRALSGLSLGATVSVEAVMANGRVVPAAGIDLSDLGLIPRPPDTIKNIFEASRPGAPALRVQDLVALRIELRGASVHAGPPPVIRTNGASKGTLILHLPPQTLGEEAFYESPPPNLDEPPDSAETETALREPPVRARAAGESRLAFELPPHTEIAYSLEAVLEAIQGLKLLVAANAKPRVKAAVVISVGDLFDIAAVNALSPRRRVALAGHVVSSLRLAARGGADVASLRARTASANSAALRPVSGGVRFVPGSFVLPRPGPKPKAPSAAQTSIEMPWRLILSPHAGAAWRHANGPVHSSATGRTELWHTRMVTPASDGSEIMPPYPDPNRTIRAIWARSGAGLERANPSMSGDLPGGADDLPVPQNRPFRMGLNDFDRFQIAHLSSNFSSPDYRPEPIDTKLMMLSALGGWLDSRGAWEPLGLSVEEWVHRASMARDHYVKVVYRGFLCPFGHRVSLVKVTERKFHKDRDGVLPDLNQHAYLRQRFYIVVREPLRLFGDPAFFATESVDGTVNYARQFPLAQVEILTDKTPDLDDPANSDLQGRGQQFFWPHVGGSPFNFQCAATDLDGRRVTFALPMIFMDNTIAAPRNVHPVTGRITPDWTLAQNFAADAATAYNASPNHTVDFGLQRLSLAPSAKPGDSAVEAREVVFNMEAPQRNGSGDAVNNPSLRSYSANLQRPLFVPKVFQVEAKLGPVAHLTGSARTNILQWNAQYLRVGFRDSGAEADLNAGEVFADVLQSGQVGQLDFSAQGDKSGGFVQPNLKPLALSRLAGPIMTDPVEFAKGKMGSGAGFPTSVSDLPLPLLFGCIPLGALIGAVADIAGEGEKVPKFVSEAGTQVETFIATLVRLYGLVSDLPSGPLGAIKGALDQAQGQVADLIAQAAAVQGAAQQAIDRMNEALALITALRSKIEAALEAAVDAVGADVDYAAALADIPALQAKLAELLAVVNGPQGQQIPANLRQTIIQMAGWLDTVLEALDDTAQVFATGKDVFDALAAIVGDPTALAQLFEDPAEFGARLQALETAIGPFRAAIEGFDLLPEGIRAALSSALDEFAEVLGIAGQIVDLIEMLTGDELTIRFDWRPEIDNWSLTGSTDPGEALFRANDKRGLVVAVEGKVKKNGSSSPQIGVMCSLNSFDLVLIAPASFLELNFDKISFSVDSNAKMDVDVLLRDIKFVGPLSFVETLRDLIPLDGFSDPPYLDITTEGIHAGFDVALPSIAVGVLNISNLSLGAGFTVPFIGQPLSVTFNFCTREQPFCLTVYMFGGGGFFAVTIDPQGVQILEAAFEFGASLSVDFGVASGGVEVMAGIYFRMEQTEASLTGYFRLGGHVSVLGLISASIELYLELEYQFSSGKCTGRAQLTIEVSVLFFSGSVTIHCERQFAGSNGDPSLREMMGFRPDLPLADELAAIDGPGADYGWREYAEAFA
ncbi:hypothetical protein [Salipiger sp. PrR002]|uniref:hypothetical protein n=1 Tax=Salipiger sp. PrR002 TaxID=2706489 RepID=UPI0019408E89|nr:hypothetical protein [Salipiger sp. PrR002]